MTDEPNYSDEINRSDEFKDTSVPNAQEESEQVQEEDARGIFRRQPVAGNRRSSNHLWLVSYSDFMTIMMIFFLGLYGYTILAKATLIREQKKSMTYTEFAQMVSLLKDPLGETIQVQDDVGKIVVQMPDDVLFASGQATVNPKAAGMLNQLADSLKRVEGDIIVEGHTDNVPLRGGRFRNNMGLSAARAFGVIEILTQSGVPPARLAAWGFGEHRPIAPNTTAAERAKNRRIQLVLLKSKDQS